MAEQIKQAEPPADVTDHCPKCGQELRGLRREDLFGRPLETPRPYHVLIGPRFISRYDPSKGGDSELLQWTCPGCGKTWEGPTLDANKPDWEIQEDKAQ